MTKQPKVSVIIPTFKTAKYLPKCIDSVLNQTFQDFEIILVSDGPTEDDDICDRYAQKDKRILVLKNIGKGLGGARNAGIEAAKGIFLAFIDSDDWIEPNFLEKMYNAMISEEDVDIVQCGTEIVFEGEINQKLKNDDENYFAIREEGIKQLTNEYYGSVNVGSWNKLYKKELIERYNLFFPEKMCNEDAYFTWAYWSICRKISYIPDKLYNYLRRDTSLMALTFNKGLREKVLDHYLVGEFFYNFLHENNIWPGREAGFWRSFLVCWYFVRNNADNIYKEFAKKVFAKFLKDKNIPTEHNELIELQKLEG